MHRTPGPKKLLTRTNQLRIYPQSPQELRGATELLTRLIDFYINWFTTKKIKRLVKCLSTWHLENADINKAAKNIYGYGEKNCHFSPNNSLMTLKATGPKTSFKVWLLLGGNVEETSRYRNQVTSTKTRPNLKDLEIILIRPRFDPTGP